MNKFMEYVCNDCIDKKRSTTPETNCQESADMPSDVSSDCASDSGRCTGSCTGSRCTPRGAHEHLLQAEGLDSKAEPLDGHSQRATCEPAPLVVPQQVLADVCCTMIRGAKYPKFIKEKEVLELKERFQARAGDVFIVSNFPIWGLQRLLVALVEGRDDPWAQDVLDKAYYCDAGASRRGAKAYLELADSWTHRRCFKTHAQPHVFPCRYPFDVQTDFAEVPPKVVVLLADPRNYLTMLFNFFKRGDCLFSYRGTFADFLKEYVEGGGENIPFTSWGEFLASWSQEAEMYPETVRLFNVDRLGSLDPKEFLSELSNVASFLNIAPERVSRLAEGVFRRPMITQPPPEMDNCGNCQHLQAALKAGHLVEPSAQNKYIFEDALSQLSFATVDVWKDMLISAAKCSSNPCVVEMAQAAFRGQLSLPPVAMTQVRKGADAHNAGVCRPCVFALRGTCKNTAALCCYCHDPSHPKTKRASRKKRAERKALQRIRTPSPGSSLN